MILSFDQINYEYRKSPRGVIHIGSHYGLEYEEYLNAGIRDMIFFEPVRSNYEGLLRTLPKDERIKTFNVALGNDTGMRKMYIETRNEGMSCTLLEPLKHLEMYPWITFDGLEDVMLDRLDNIEFDRSLFNVLNIDVQGYELEVLKGAEKTLDSVDLIFTEVNAVEMYRSCALVTDLDSYLKPLGFVRVLDNIEHNGRWGDALYVKI